METNNKRRKVHVTREVFVSEGEQKIIMQPTPEWDGSVELRLSEYDNSLQTLPFYLNSEEIDVFCQQLKELREYIQK